MCSSEKRKKQSMGQTGTDTKENLLSDKERHKKEQQEDKKKKPFAGKKEWLRKVG